MTSGSPPRSSQEREPTAEHSYEVGYGKPPKASQFKPGQSGNPSGRRKRPKSVSEQLDEILKRKVEITQNGKAKRVSLQELLLTTLVNKAAKGDLAALKTVMELKASHNTASSETIDVGLLGTEAGNIIEAFLKEQALGDGLGSSDPDPEESDNG